jgi:DNA processing protein
LRPILGGGFREPESGAPVPPPADWEAQADRIRTQVEEALGPAPVAVDDLIRQTGAPAGAVLTVLLELELAGRCARHPGNRVSWADTP